MILDEATSNLDIRHALALLEQIKGKIEEQGRTVIAVFSGRQPGRPVLR